MAGFKKDCFYVYNTSIKKVTGPYLTNKEALNYCEDGDVVLLVTDTGTKKKLLNSAVINFNDNSLTIDGQFKEYQTGVYEIPDKMLSTIIDDVYSETKDVTIIGVPPLKGVCLDEVLYM